MGVEFDRRGEIFALMAVISTKLAIAIVALDLQAGLKIETLFCGSNVFRLIILTGDIVMY